MTGRCPGGRKDYEVLWQTGCPGGTKNAPPGQSFFRAAVARGVQTC